MKLAHVEKAAEAKKVLDLLQLFQSRYELAFDPKVTLTLTTDSAGLDVEIELPIRHVIDIIASYQSEVRKELYELGVD
jgi:hypothetical protein